MNNLLLCKVPSTHTARTYTEQILSSREELVRHKFTYPKLARHLYGPVRRPALECIQKSTVDWEIFVVKIIRVLNFRVKNISPPDGSAM